MSRLKSRDIRAVYRLLGDIRSVGSQPDRWPMFALDGIRRLLNAQFASGALVPLPEPGKTGPIVPEVHMLVGLDDQEAIDRHEKLLSSGNMPMGAYFERRFAMRLRFSAMRRQDVISDEEFYADPVSQSRFLDLGVDHFLHSEFVALSIGKIAAMFVLRSVGKPPFDRRELRMFKLFHLEMARMWKTDLAVPDDFQVRELAPRQKQVLWMLCSGESEKRIAERLDISPHTVHDYVKALYKHFDVSGRNELLVKVLRHPSNRLGEMAMPSTDWEYRGDL
ncbi:MAG: helix-turn-helix transcriptional regulator [Pirellulaceae bacterium]